MKTQLPGGASEMRRPVVLSVAAGSLLLAGAFFPAAAADMVTKAPVASIADTWWVFHGDVELGGRFFANDPNKNGIASQGQKSLGKYYEYSDIKPGVFGNAWLNGQTKDGLYNFDIWAENPGYNDQRFEAGVSKAGEYYFDIGWDQTPHIYSTNAQTLYSGLGGNALVLPPGLSNTLFLDAGCVRVAGAQPAGCTSGNPTAGQRAAIQRDITSNLYTTDIGIRRDTAAVAFRWTPTDAWDINFNYSNMHRWGSQVEGVVFSPGTSGVVAQVPKPVDDRTQNFGVNGEYKGTSPWGKTFTFKLGYAGSIYEDGMGSYTVQNPFCGTGSGMGECARNGSPSSPFAQMSLWPDNSAHGLSATAGADLPLNSRYMGTLAYTMMRQNQAFLPFSPFGTMFTSGNTTPGPLPTMPAGSLNGAINTLLSNNVVTTQISPELKSKLSYRYYNYDNNTPELFFSDWTVTDVKGANTTTSTYAPVSSLSMSYTKQNAGAELVWTPNRQWNLGTGYSYERYNWTRESANITHENGGKVFADYKPWSWLTARASYAISDRHYDTYDYRGLYGNFQWSDPLCINPQPSPAQQCNVQISTAMRQFYLDNRERQVAKFSLAIDVLRGLTVTPTFGYQDDDYSISATEAGLTRSQSVKAGAEVAYAYNPWTNVLFAYMYENYRQNLKYTTACCSATINPMTAANTWHADIVDHVNTFMAAANWGAIPDKLDFRLSYTVTLSSNDQPIRADSGAQPAQGSGAAGTGGNFPDVKGQWSRLEAQAKYTFDKDSVRFLGVHGQAYAKLRYAWERNSVNNYDQDIMQAYMNPLINNTGFMTWMAYNNPNYNVHLIGASLGVKW